MAAKKKTKKAKKAGPAEFIISKSRTKAAVSECNVSSEFYEALDNRVREIIAEAEERTLGNGRKTIKPVDL